MISGAALGLTAVMLGAFGAHGLEKYLDHNGIVSFETGVRYQMYHALLLFLIGGVFNFTKSVNYTLLCLVSVGVLCFSGSIYLLSTQPFTGLDFSKIALMTPLGGTLLIVSWGLILYQFVKLKNE